MVYPTNGNGGGPGQSAVMLALLIFPILVLFLRWLKKTLGAHIFPKQGCLIRVSIQSILNPKSLRRRLVGGWEL